MYTPAKITKKIGKESITFYFGLGAFHLFCEKRGIELEEIESQLGKDSKDPTGALADLFCSAANFNLLALGEEEKYNRYMAFVWIEQMTDEDLKNITNVMSKSQQLNTVKKKSPRARQGSKK